MFEVPSLRDEARYGMPTADQLLFNRRYVVGYSYLFRQPRWALELINRHTIQMDDEDLRRLDNFPGRSPCSRNVSFHSGHIRGFKARPRASHIECRPA